MHVCLCHSKNLFFKKVLTFRLCSDGTFGVYFSFHLTNLAVPLLVLIINNKAIITEFADCSTFIGSSSRGCVAKIRVLLLLTKQLNVMRRHCYNSMHSHQQFYELHCLKVRGSTYHSVCNNSDHELGAQSRDCKCRCLEPERCQWRDSPNDLGVVQIGTITNLRTGHPEVRPTGGARR